MRLNRQESEGNLGETIALPITTETIVAEGVSVSTEPGNVKVFLQGLVTLTPGGSTTSVVIRIRRGSTTSGTEVEKLTVEATVSKKTVIPIMGADQPGEVAGQPYVLTAEAAGAEAHTAAKCHLHVTF